MSDNVFIEDGRIWWIGADGRRCIESTDDYARRTGREVRNLTVPRGACDRPAHVRLAIADVDTIVEGHTATIARWQWAEVRSYIAQLERRLASRRPTVLDRIRLAIARLRWRLRTGR